MVNDQTGVSGNAGKCRVAEEESSESSSPGFPHQGRQLLHLVFEYNDVSANTWRSFSRL